jgi:glycine/D-amino acid oxidase-like deaminating enzyme
VTARSAIVVGAGIFGVSVAERLARDGWAVTLVDRDEPGHPRATSSSHSRIIRCAHGEERFYTRLAWRALELWRELEAATGAELLLESGVLWLAQDGDGWEASRRTLDELGIPTRILEGAELARAYPSFEASDLSHALLEPRAGVLLARRGVQVLAALAADHGARLERAEARPTAQGAVRIDGEIRRADRVVWCCGPWLGRLFPDLAPLRVTRCEYATFAAGPEWSGRTLPVFYDADGPVYGMGDIDGVGFKVAPDRTSEEFDPDTEDRPLRAAEEVEARAYLARRFPALADAPRIGGRVCQYELTADNQFLIGPHPADDSVWLVGGGSGHGYKHGPALAEYVAELLDGRREPLPQHALGPREARAELHGAATDLV